MIYQAVDRLFLFSVRSREKKLSLSCVHSVSLRWPLNRFCNVFTKHNERKKLHFSRLLKDNFQFGMHVDLVKVLEQKWWSLCAQQNHWRTHLGNRTKVVSSPISYTSIWHSALQVITVKQGLLLISNDCQVLIVVEEVSIKHGHTTIKDICCDFELKNMNYDVTKLNEQTSSNKSRTPTIAFVPINDLTPNLNM